MKIGIPLLLVSVRSASEANHAISGGASIVDVKEPTRGPLGMADFSVWQEVRAVVPSEVPVSVALGELADWRNWPAPPRSVFDGIAFRKIGLANAGDDWADQWTDLRDQLGHGPAWIAVIYRDWVEINAPEPDAVIHEAKRAQCAGVLIDTWNKSVTPRLDPSWQNRVKRIKDEIGLVALAGGLDEHVIRQLSPLAPDYFAVRGAACTGSNRTGEIDAARVAALVRACRAVTPIGLRKSPV